MNNILVHICENNKSGNRSGFARAFDFSFQSGGDFFLRLESKSVSGVMIKELVTGTIKIYGMDILFQEYWNWIGNMMWNRYTLSPVYSIGLLNLLRYKKDFSASDGYSRIVQKWDSDQNIVAFDLGINDKTVVPVIIDPNQINLF